MAHVTESIELDEKTQVTTAQLADLLGFSTKYTAELADKGILVRVSHGKWLMRDSVRNYVRWLKGKGEASPQSGYEADKARKMAADADLAEIEAAKAAGKLVETKVIRRRWESAVVACRTKLLTIPDRSAPKVVVAPSLESAKKILRDEISDALESLVDVKHEPDAVESAAGAGDGDEDEGNEGDA